jgi:antirestriction protein
LAPAIEWITLYKSNAQENEMSKDLTDILSGDTFDSREVIDRIDELENENTDDEGDIVFTDESDKEEYAALKAIEDEADGYASDWKYGVNFISDGHFVSYAQELADDIGAVDSDAGWPNSHIDWESAADELQMDYTGIEIEGSTWWYR